MRLRPACRSRRNQRQGRARPEARFGLGRRGRRWITRRGGWTGRHRWRARSWSRRLALGSERSDADHRLTEARTLRARSPCGWRRSGGGWGGRRRRRGDSDHRAAKTVLGLGRREADDGLTQGSDRLTAARAPGRFRGISRSAVRAQPHRAHYNPGRTPATKLVSSPRLQGLCPVSPFSRKGVEIRVPCSPNVSSRASTFATVAS